MESNNTDNTDNTRVVKARVLLTNGTRIDAWLHYPDNGRVQEVLNDTRAFLPVHILQESPSPGYKIVFLQKSHILTIEFIQDSEQ